MKENESRIVIVHGTIAGEYDKEKFVAKIEKNGKITKWKPLK